MAGCKRALVGDSKRLMKKHAGWLLLLLDINICILSRVRYTSAAPWPPLPLNAEQRGGIRQPRQ